MEVSGSCIFHYEPMGYNDAPGAGPVWTPGARLAGFIKRTTYILGLVVSENKIFYVFPIVSLWQLMKLRAGPFLTPGSWLAGFIEDHHTLLHTKYESSGPCGFCEENLLCFSHDAPGASPVWTPGARLARFIKRTPIHC